MIAFLFDASVAIDAGLARQPGAAGAARAGATPRAVRYWIWFVASVKFLVPLALLQQLGDRLGRSLPEPLPVDVALVETASAVFVPSSPRGLATPDAVLSQLLPFAAAIWALGAALLCLRWLPAVVLRPVALAFAPEVSA